MAESPESLLEQLEQIVSPRGMERDPAQLRALAGDFYRGNRATPPAAATPVTPLAAVRPASTDEVAACVRVAAAYGIPIVEHGGGTGLMGGARSIRTGLVMDMRGMQRVLAVSRVDRTVHAEAGAVLADVITALEPEGLMLGHDPWTVPIATVGGTISTNGLGFLGGRYGSMGDQVLGLTVVLAGGDVVRTRPVPRSSTGPRLNRLFAGAEGTLGIITEAVLQAFPLPERRQLVGYQFDGFDTGYWAIQALFDAGLRPSMVDFGQTYSGDRTVMANVTPDGERGLLYLAFEGLREEVRAVVKRATAMLDGLGGKRLTARAADRFWVGRHVVAEEIRARRVVQPLPLSEPALPSTLFDYMHVAVAPSRVLEFKRLSRPLLVERGVSIGEWGLWNQPELFSMTFFRQVESSADVAAFYDAIDDVLRLTQDVGGSMEYCHGAGLRLAHLMEREHGRGLELLRDIKHALDPAGLLNPGKLGL